jgi:hypothetical protein
MSMAYTFPTTFHALYDKAVAAFSHGVLNPDKLFDPAEVVWIKANGLSVQNFFDYAEDHIGSGEPGYEHALSIELIRRDYFLNIQNARPTGRTVDPSYWPAKDAAIDGIVWLPRIIPKVRAKLLGELPTTMMYGCGGDRRFFKTHDILPAEFLSLAWRYPTDDQGIINWVKVRSACQR